MAPFFTKIYVFLYYSKGSKLVVNVRENKRERERKKEIEREREGEGGETEDEDWRRTAILTIS